MAFSEARARARRTLAADRIRTEVLGFYLAVVLALLAVALGAAVVSRTIARDQALNDAERMTIRLSELTIRPLLQDWLERPNPENLATLNATVWQRMSDGYLTEVTIWSSSGRIVYADNNAAIGKLVDPPPREALAAITSGTITSNYEDEPELEPGQTEVDNEGFVEVYVPLELPGQPRLSFEAYYDYGRVNDVASDLLRSMLPVVLVPLMLLQLIQLPLANSLVRRARRHEKERSALLERALSVSDRERIRFAADLHDGPIQDLAGIGYALGAVAPNLPSSQQPLMTATQDALGRSIESLRTLMTDLYPPDLTTVDFEQTVLDLARPLEANGTAVQVVAGSVPAMSEDSLRALYRVVRESFANIAKHAHATEVSVILTETANDPRSANRDAVELVITDNGVGLDQSRLDRRREGHLGLRLLRDRVASMGGELTISGEPGGGTTVRAVVPVADAALRSPGVEDSEPVPLTVS